MLLFLFVGVLLGFARYNTRPWWRAVALSGLAQVAAGTFFASGGTLDNPAGDGFITMYLRQISHDGPLVTWGLVGAAIFAWVVPAVLLVRAAYTHAPEGEYGDGI